MHKKQRNNFWGSDVTAFIDDMGNAHSLRSAIRFVSFLRNELNTQFGLFPKHIAGADLLIGSSLTFALATLTETMAIEYRYTAKKLGAAIWECLSNEQIRQQVRKASEIIRQQDSLEFTVNEVLGSIDC